MSVLWMCGNTPPPAMVARTKLSSSSSPRIASCKCRGVMRFTRRSLDAFPANSRTSAVKYSKIADAYTAALAPMRTWFCVRFFKCRWIRPTGNWVISSRKDGVQLLSVTGACSRPGAFLTSVVEPTSSRHYDVHRPNRSSNIGAYPALRCE